ncbi:hypothetical protein [Flavonifractor sp. An82]|uniref:hypothetical protein n=1 Tax=Flavonifractor sp. An82 TaxID=1965660 RepID=UPI0013A5FC1C|nr:hypothetical protein [Flavonifractor sp. An82]
MFSARDLKNILSSNIPDNALVYVRADYADYLGEASKMIVTRTPITEQYPDPNSFIWEVEGYESLYDKDDLAQYDQAAPITAICFM